MCTCFLFSNFRLDMRDSFEDIYTEVSILVKDYLPEETSLDSNPQSTNDNLDKKAEGVA